MLSFTPRSNLGRLPVPRLGAAIRVEPLLCCGKCRVELLEASPAISYAQEGQFRFAESERIYEGGQSRASSKCYDYRKPSHIYDSLLDRGHRFGYRESAKQQRVPEP